MTGAFSAALSSLIAMGCGGVMRVKNMGLPRHFIIAGNGGATWGFARIMTGLAAEAPEHKTISIDATYLKAQRMASSLRLRKGGKDV